MAEALVGRHKGVSVEKGGQLRTLRTKAAEKDRRGGRSDHVEDLTTEKKQKR